MTQWVGHAPAKVNLSLRILARERSGFHQIETVYQQVEWADRIEVERRPGEDVELEVGGVPEGVLGAPEDNLAVRAARRVQDAIGASGGSVPGFRIRLEKRIPHGAGLGGGSSDAASVLRGANLLSGSPLGDEELLALSGEIGSDVPFFLCGTPRALAWGRGDRILPLPALPARDVVLVVPEERISTPWAYQVLADWREAHGIHRAASVCHPTGMAGDWPRVGDEAQNDFESALFPLRPDLAELKRILAERGGRPALLSGSGAGVFAVFHAPGAAQAGAAAIADQIPSATVLRTRTVA